MHGRILIALTLLVVFASPEAQATSPKFAPIPPGRELQILDPRVDPRGLPTTIPQISADGSMQIDIPPTVIVHKYYYTGNRSFQASLIPGGPTVVVANHPKNGERVYVPVQLPAGAPKIIYTHKSIEYDFGHQGVKIVFNCLAKRPKVEYRNRARLKTKVAQPISRLRNATKNALVRTGIAEAAVRAKQTTKNVVVNGLDRASDIGKMALTPIRQTIRLIPGVNLLTSTPEDRASQLRGATSSIEELRNAPVDQFIPTNR